ncbi:MAG: hypothetical protein R3B84_02210 [Zavarzinella sp.]
MSDLLNPVEPNNPVNSHIVKPAETPVAAPPKKNWWAKLSEKQRFAVVVGGSLVALVGGVYTAKEFVGTTEPKANVAKPVASNPPAAENPATKPKPGSLTEDLGMPVIPAANNGKDELALRPAPALTQPKIEIPSITMPSVPPVEPGKLPDFNVPKVPEFKILPAGAEEPIKSPATEVKVPSLPPLPGGNEIAPPKLDVTPAKVEMPPLPGGTGAAPTPPEIKVEPPTIKLPGFNNDTKLPPTATPAPELPPPPGMGIPKLPEPTPPSLENKLPTLPEPGKASDPKLPTLPEAAPKIDVTPPSLGGGSPKSTVPAELTVPGLPPLPGGGSTEPKLPGTEIKVPELEPKIPAVDVGAPKLPDNTGIPKVTVTPTVSPMLPEVGTPKLPDNTGIPKVTVTPAVSPMLPTIGAKKDTFEEDWHKPAKGDNYTSLSKTYFNTEKYAAALQAYNREGNKAQDGIIRIPPIWVLEEKFGGLIDDPDIRRTSSNETVPTVKPAPAETPKVPEITPPKFEPIEKPAPEPIGSSQPMKSQKNIYTVNDSRGESIRSIAERIYGNGNYWKRLLDLNPSLDPTLPVPAGTQLRVE